MKRLITRKLFWQRCIATKPLENNLEIEALRRGITRVIDKEFQTRNETRMRKKR